MRAILKHSKQVRTIYSGSLPPELDITQSLQGVTIPEQKKVMFSDRSQVILEGLKYTENNGNLQHEVEYVHNLDRLMNPKRKNTFGDISYALKK